MKMMVFSNFSLDVNFEITGLVLIPIIFMVFSRTNR